MLKKLLIDLFSFICVIFVMEYKFTGGLAHEIIGILMLLVIIIHLIFNRKWIKQVTLKFKNVPQKTKVNYIIDAFIGVAFITIIVTGIMLSLYLFPVFTLDNRHVVFIIHKAASYTLVILMMIHVIMHHKMIINFVFKKVPKKAVVSLIVLICFLCIAFFPFRKLIKPCTEKGTNDDELNNPGYESDNSSSQSGSNNSNNTTETEPDKNDTENKDDTPNQNDEEDKIIPTLFEYLSKLRCTGCGRHCLLTSPSCGTGRSQANAATQRYYAMYPSARQKAHNVLPISDNLFSYITENEVNVIITLI